MELNKADRGSLLSFNKFLVSYFVPDILFLQESDGKSVSLNAVAFINKMI